MGLSLWAHGATLVSGDKKGWERVYTQLYPHRLRTGLNKYT